MVGSMMDNGSQPIRPMVFHTCCCGEGARHCCARYLIHYILLNRLFTRHVFKFVNRACETLKSCEDILLAVIENCVIFNI
jgi:hypothetical protein